MSYCESFLLVYPVCMIIMREWLNKVPRWQVIDDAHDSFPEVPKSYALRPRVTTLNQNLTFPLESFQGTPVLFFLIFLKSKGRPRARNRCSSMHLDILITQRLQLPNSYTALPLWVHLLLYAGGTPFLGECKV
jgi:hypothetical protein